MRVTVDCIGEMCPIPIIKAERSLEPLVDKDQVCIITDHSCTMQAIAIHFQDKKSYPCQVEEIDNGIWQIIIEKRG